MYSSKLCYTGSYVPPRTVSNDELSRFVDTNDEWIRTRCGIEKRHFTINENTATLAYKACQEIVEKGNIDPLSIDLLIVATVSGNYSTPSTACIVQSYLGAANAVAFDVSAACSGFVYALSIADKFIKAGVYRNAIVVGAETLSKLLDFDDRTTSVLFGDGAAGAYLERAEGEGPGILAEVIGSDGSKHMALTANHVIPQNIVSEEEEKNDLFIRMDGRAIFDFATRIAPKCILETLEKANLSAEDIDFVIPHQANIRIIKVISRKVKIPLEKFYINIEEYGNTSSASIPIALNEMVNKGIAKKGDKILLVGFGAGLTWGSMLIEL